MFPAKVIALFIVSIMMTSTEVVAGPGASTVTQMVSVESAAEDNSKTVHATSVPQSMGLAMIMAVWVSTKFALVERSKGVLNSIFILHSIYNQLSVYRSRRANIFHFPTVGLNWLKPWKYFEYSGLYPGVLSSPLSTVKWSGSIPAGIGTLSSRASESLCRLITLQPSGLSTSREKDAQQMQGVVSFLEMDLVVEELREVELEHSSEGLRHRFRVED
ncbi:hypothetical protein L218DRAFT_949057 [Marasmius fiardii PR-910]|nr:hypothetical protein L218DRAFT_949057 [Marasmius fiardii PR-910]